MSSDEEFLPPDQNNKNSKKTDMEHDKNSQTEESNELSELDSCETVNERNCNLHSDSDNEDFNVVARTRKCARPLVDSDSEVVSDEITGETKHNKITAFNNAAGSQDLHSVADGKENKGTEWDSDCSDGQSEKCPICLSKFHGQDIGTPESCDHSFCLECLLEWEKKVNTCPVDRLPFLLILVRQKLEGKIIRRAGTITLMHHCLNILRCIISSIKTMIPVSTHTSTDTWLEQDDDDESDLTYCEVCGQCDREDRLLLCDSCDLGYHCECLDPPLEIVPVGEWFCPSCDTSKWPEQSNLTEDMMADFREMLRSRFRPGSSVFQHRVIARTLASETVRHRIQRRREAQLESMRNSRRFNEDTAIVTAVTKRRFAHRLGLQRTTQSIFQSSNISYSDILALASASYQDDEVSYDSSSDDDDVDYASDKYLQNTTNTCHWNRSPSYSIASSTNSRSATTQRIRVPSPPANHSSIDVLNTILQTQSLLHSNSQDITVEKDGSLTLRPTGSTQQRPQNPQERSASTEKYGSLPSNASCSSKSSRSETQIDQLCGLPSASRQSHVSDSYSGNRYDGQRSSNCSSILYDENKKKECQHLNRTREAKTQSEDEVDIYSDIESVVDDVLEDEPDVSNNEHCNITNIYRGDLQLDAIDEDSDSGDNELIIDEDVKVEEEDSHSGEWNEDNFNVHSPQEESSHNNFALLEASSHNNSSPLEGSDHNNFSLQEESNHDNFSPQEESNPNFSPQGSSHNNSSQEESDQNDFTFKEENKCELDVMVASPHNYYQECESDEVIDILNQNICEPKSCDTVNSEVSAEEVMDDDEAEKDDDDELSDNYNDTLHSVQGNEGSSEEDEEQTNKASNDESMSPSHNNITPQSGSPPELEINAISEQRTSFTEHSTMYKSKESCGYISKEEDMEDCSYEKEMNIAAIGDNQSNLKRSDSESCGYISKEEDMEDCSYEKEMNIAAIGDNHANLKRSDSEIYSNITEENSGCSSPINDDRNADIEEENESQESDTKSISEKEETIIFNKVSSPNPHCSENKTLSNNFKSLNNEELNECDNNRQHNCDISEHEMDIMKFAETHSSIMPAEDVEDISEAGSDDTKFKDTIEDWEIEADEHIVAKRMAENPLHEDDDDERNIDDVEERVAKLFANEDLSPQHRKTANQYVKNDITRTIKEDRVFGNRSNTLEEEREEGEIIEEAPPKRHKSRSRKSHRRESVHHDDAEDYGDLAPRVNISDLPRIPKIKKDKGKVDNQEEVLSSSKRTSVLSRIDVGISSEVSWKKLSRSTRERSYRDGRPKDNRLLFGDREIKQKSKRDEEHQRKDDDSRRKEERYKRPENEKWRDKSDRERSKDRVDKQRESSRDKSEKRLEKDWKLEKCRDKKDDKEKSFDKFHREEKSHRDKHKHKHKDKDSSKEYKIDKDKMQEKDKHSYLHHSHERDHSKPKDRKPKQTETKFKEVITKKEIRKEKPEKIPDRKGTKHEKKRHEEGHRHYEHRRKDELCYPEITAIESKEIYTKGDSIIINVNFNRNTGKELAIEEVKSIQKDTKRTKLKEKFSNDKRLEKSDTKYKQKHCSHLIDQAETSSSKHISTERCEQKKKSVEKVQIGELLWKETEDLIPTNDEIEERLNDDDQLGSFKNHDSPTSLSEESEKMREVVTKELKNKTLLSPYNDENNDSQNSFLCSSPKRRSPRSPSPPSPTENDSYDPCDPTSSPFLHKSSSLSPENTLCSLDTKPVPPPSPVLPPLPLEPEPPNHSSVQDKSINTNSIIEKTCSSPDLSSPDSGQGKSSTPGNSMSLSQVSHFPLPNTKVPPPNYSHKLAPGITATSSSIQASPTNLKNWNSGSTSLLFMPHASQPSVQGAFIPSHLTQAAINTSQTAALMQTPIAVLPQTHHLHSSGQSTSFMNTMPNIRVPPPQVSLNLSQQSHVLHSFVSTSTVAAGTAIKSTPDIMDVIDMEVESPYTPGDSPTSSGDKSTSQKQTTVLPKDKFDVLISNTAREHSCSSTTPIKRYHDDARILAEKIKQSQIFSKSVISVLDKMNKKLLSSKKLQQSSSSAKRCKVESKQLDPNRSRHTIRVDATKLTVSSKRESRPEKKEVINRLGEAQRTVVDDLPSSAVEMQVKEKFLKKLNRQERVVEEVKLCLKPYYSRREIDKEEYKEIMRKSVPKVCHNRSGDINPVKIKTLIEGYIRKFKHHRKKASKMQKAKIS